MFIFLFFKIRFSLRCLSDKLFTNIYNPFIHFTLNGIMSGYGMKINFVSLESDFFIINSFNFNMSPFAKKILFAISVFAVFMILATVLKLVSGQQSEEGLILGLFSETDLLLGVAVAALVTFNRERKKKQQ